MTNAFDSAYFHRFRHQNVIQRTLLPRIDRKEPLFSALVSHFSTRTKPPKLLDIGCGSGLFLKYACKHFDCTGLDISSTAIKLARKAAPKATCITSGFEYLKKFPADHFDVITCFDVLEHVDNHSQKLEQIYRILKSEGLLAFSAPNRDCIGTRLKGYQAFTFKDPTHVWHLSSTQWQYVFANSGFVPYRTWHGGLIDPPYLSHIPTALQTLFIKYPTQIASLYGIPIPSKFGEVVFMLLLKSSNHQAK